MPKSETEKQFDYLVSKIIGPHFKSLGYKKSGNNFRYYNSDGEFGKIVNFQKSSYYSKDHIHFTINIGLYLAEFELYHTGKNSGEKFAESICAVRQRIGALMNKNDIWYDLNPETNIAQLQERLEQNIVRKVIPYLNKIKTREDIITQLLIEGSDYFVARIKTLFRNGHQKRALNILEQEYRRVSDIGAKWLDDLKKELTES